MAVYLIESKVDQQKLIDYVGEDTAKLFFSMKDRLKSPENDIYYWLKKRPDELIDRLNQLQSTQTRSQKDEEASKGAELVYKDGVWKVYHITTYEASVKYGKNTQWCISGSKRWSNGERGEEYFNDYVSKGIEFYFYIKSNDEKYALAYYPQGETYQVFDAKDNDITAEDLFFLPKVEGLPDFDYGEMFDEDGVFIYKGGYVPESIRPKITKARVALGVEEISDSAFAGSFHLKSIELPDSLKDIGISAFEFCGLESIEIPKGVSRISAWAFGHCDDLVSIDLPDSVSVLGNGVFENCTGLKSITLSENLLILPNRLLADCVSLKSVRIPESVEILMDQVFANCESLESIIIPNSKYLDTIGKGVFDRCSNLTVYTDNKYVQDYCEHVGGSGVKWKSLSGFDPFEELMDMASE